MKFFFLILLVIITAIILIYASIDGGAVANIKKQLGDDFHPPTINKNPIFVSIAGSPGSGKTWMGEKLTKMGYFVIDTDDIIWRNDLFSRCDSIAYEKGLTQESIDKAGEFFLKIMDAEIKRITAVATRNLIFVGIPHITYPYTTKNNFFISQEIQNCNHKFFISSDIENLLGNILDRDYVQKICNGKEFKKRLLQGAESINMLSRSGIERMDESLATFYMEMDYTKKSQQEILKFISKKINKI